MKCLELLNRMADIQAEMREISEEDGFVAISPSVIQISVAMFRELFPDALPAYSEISHSKHYVSEIAGLKITACEVGT